MIIVEGISSRVGLPALIKLVTRVNLMIRVIQLMFSLNFRQARRVNNDLMSRAIRPKRLPNSRSCMNVYSRRTNDGTSFCCQTLSFQPWNLMNSIRYEARLISMFNYVSAYERSSFVCRVEVSSKRAFLLATPSRVEAVGLRVVCVCKILIRDATARVMLQ